MWYPFVGICGTEFIGMSVPGFRIYGTALADSRY